MTPKLIFARYIRSFIFGVEDSLVSTVGLLSGIASVGASTETIFVTGVILLFVEGFSMAVGSFLSERSAEEYISGENTTALHTILGALVMFFSFFFAGLIPLFPYLIWTPLTALPISIVVSLLTLFTLGYATARIFKTHSTAKSALRMMLIGGIAIALGVIVGNFVQGI